MFDLHISPIEREEIIERYSRIRPVAEKNGRLYWLRTFNHQELFNIGYLWHDNTERPVGENEIIPVPDKDFRCLHAYGDYGIFKPTIAEVLMQIDPEVAYSVVAFEIIEYPQTTDDIYKDDFAAAAFSRGYYN